MAERWFYAFSFRDELDMLRVQLAEHGDRVHKFIIMEATVDHSGQPKPLVLADHWAEFSDWHHQIEYIVADWLPTYEQNPSFWFREQRQRDIGMPYFLKEAKDDDAVIVSDVDEFVPRAALPTFLQLGAPTAGLLQKLRYAALDWDGSPGITAVMARGLALRNGMATFDILRQRREGLGAVIEPGGYHFSWFGGPERIERKAICSPHQETLETNLRLAREGFAWQRGLGGVTDNPSVTGNVAVVDDTYPGAVLRREVPWYWWRPGPDNLPVDAQARDAEIKRRSEAPFFLGECGSDLTRAVRFLEPGSYHLDDHTPCPTAVARTGTAVL